ncbi:LuxR family DNA-binding response regulator [Burkholderia gladioli BSR3]|uniref:LuxR family DNA-binding response regulator n=3 Tax=Burkholderia TaxID=32008 RepID=F2LGK7_BURGS|nr:LuxR family DNA-binding response regulator [Burkholderia gladioli BSR3]
MGRRYSRLPIDTPARRALVMFANTTFNVLIADDHPLVVTGVESALRDLRSLRIVGTAGNSTQIVERLGREACDLLITDFVMPDGRYNDGLTMLTYIRSHFPDLPVIVFTAVDGIALTGELTRLGVKAIVNKADDVGHLISAIYAVHAGSEYLSPSVSRANPRLRGTARRGGLTRSELEVLRLYVSGLSITQIADKLRRTKQTISAQKIKAMHKLGVERDADLYLYIYQSKRGDSELFGI